MDKVANASINNLRISEADFVPSSEQSITISLSDLRQIITEAVQKAIEPLQDRIESLEATVARQDEKIRSLETTATLQEDNQLIQLRLINDLREAKKKEPGMKETARAEKIEKYLLSRPDHRATFETLKGHLGIDNDLLGIAIRSLLPSGKYAIIKTPGDRRRRTLVMLPR